MTKNTCNSQTTYVPYIVKDDEGFYCIAIKESAGTFYFAETGMRSMITARSRLKRIRREMFEAFFEMRRLRG